MDSRMNLVLGLDLGTTSVKAVILHPETYEVLHACSQDTNADVTSDIGPLGSEQDVVKIMKAAEKCVQNLDHENLKKVSLIGVSGQMHGCMLWKEKPWMKNGRGEIELIEAKYSRLYTWQDSRCTQEFLTSLPVPESHLRIATGHGCASMFWLQKHCPEYVESFDRAGTVMDFVVSALCDLDHPVMSVQTAASWGYFDTRKNEWNLERLLSAGFPTHLLPEVKYPGCIAGHLETSWLGLVPVRTQVSAAMGDLPCSVLPSLENPTDAVINIGTSAQVVTRAPKGFAPPTSKAASSVEYFPFFEGRYLKVAAALNGGNAIAAFIDMLHEWMSALGCHVTKDSMYDKAISAAMQVGKTDLVINPTLLGERHQPDLRASVSNIMTNNVSLGHVMRAMCCGVITNLHNMLPRESLVEDGVTRIVGCGSALVRNKILQEELERIFGLSVVYKEGGNAAVGAALGMILYHENNEST
ncbi:sedoheptulokinase-like [Amphiura filiformis]|uniref:sedoheptulokinase-like n=1 Tax=Amphiura filiformis TaxID=82378 RepID=UPI003B219B83